MGIIYIYCYRIVLTVFLVLLGRLLWSLYKGTQQGHKDNSIEFLEKQLCKAKEENILRIKDRITELKNLQSRYYHEDVPNYEKQIIQLTKNNNLLSNEINWLSQQIESTEKELDVFIESSTTLDGSYVFDKTQLKRNFETIQNLERDLTKAENQNNKLINNINDIVMKKSEIDTEILETLDKIKDCKLENSELRFHNKKMAETIKKTQKEISDTVEFVSNYKNVELVDFLGLHSLELRKLKCLTCIRYFQFTEILVQKGIMRLENEGVFKENKNNYHFELESIEYQIRTLKKNKSLLSK